MSYQRPDGRAHDALRPVTITPDFVGSAEGSCLIEFGGTRVICTASVVASVPPWREASGLGWVTAEYGMLPASTGRRKARPIGKPDSRGVEIQRLIGRVIRNVVNFEQLADTTICLDCDVLEADGGTRTASITGAYVALARAVASAERTGQIQPGALGQAVTAVSVGMVEGSALLDLCYAEDSIADVDMNIAMTADGKFLEIQGTSEREPFDAEQLRQMLDLAAGGIETLRARQNEAIGSP